MERRNEREENEERGGGIGGGSFGSDYRGMDERLDEVDLEGAQEAGSDPPGGLGTDIGGGTDGLGRDDPDRGDRIGG
jgi:hypothetical protein